MLLTTFLGSFLYAQSVTIRADVTGDGVYDDVKVGEDYVLLVDKMSCCKRTKRFVVDECDSIVDVTVDDYHRGMYGKEIAVVQSGESGPFTDIYACTSNRIEQVAFGLPGRVVRDEEGMIFCHERYASGTMKVTVPYPLDINGRLLGKMPGVQKRDTIIVVDPGSQKHVVFHIPSGSNQVICAVSDHTAVEFVLQDRNGDLLEAEHADGQMTAILNAGQEVRDAEVVIDNRDAHESANVYCVTIQYENGE